ncbi:hypothetical protein HMPREF9080_00665 [Cardiobacterium valvarum F0432]|uniref:Uncharacterized protein n=1 Tax=Cardiobacterium valvarum F0432 TaxID=797473 RepID=G9ZD32_9GAMM|nr:hypothetical protein HMPREF9080_00665 [Cardiobacterium valvarum F0432]
MISVLRSDYAASRTAYFAPCLVCDPQGLTIYARSGSIQQGVTDKTGAFETIPSQNKPL